MDVIVKNTFSLLCLPDLNYLYRGGRIGRAKSLLGKVELRYEKLIHGHPRLVEVIHTGPGAWAASFALN